MKVSQEYLISLLNLRFLYPEKGAAQFVDGMSLDLESDHAKARIVLDDSTLNVAVTSRETGHSLLRFEASGDFLSPRAEIEIVGAEIGEESFLEDIQSVFTVYATYASRLVVSPLQNQLMSTAEVTP